MEHRPLSPTVWATIATTKAGTELVVLWRGTPGWYMRPGPRSEHGSGGTDSLSVSLEYAGIQLSMALDRRSRDATVGTTTVKVPLEANTLLVDHVDDPGRMSIAGFSTLQLTSMMTNAELASALSRVGDTVMFLQCDQKWEASPSFAQMSAIICDQIVRR